MHRACQPGGQGIGPPRWQDNRPSEGGSAAGASGPSGAASGARGNGWSIVQVDLSHAWIALWPVSHCISTASTNLNDLESSALAIAPLHGRAGAGRRFRGASGGCPGHERGFAACRSLARFLPFMPSQGLPKAKTLPKKTPPAKKIRLTWFFPSWFPLYANLAPACPSRSEGQAKNVPTPSYVPQTPARGRAILARPP